MNCSIIPIDHINIATSNLTFDSFSLVAQGVRPQSVCATKSSAAVLPSTNFDVHRGQEEVLYWSQ